MPVSTAPHDISETSEASPTVLIASEHLVAKWSEQVAPLDLIAIADRDARNAPGIIKQHKARVVVLERLFANSAKGLALIQELRSNPELVQLEIRMLPEDQAAALGYHATGRALAHMSTPLGRQPSRRARRVALQPGTTALLNGTDVDVVELSVAGAHVIASTMVKPHENVWVAIVRGDESLRTNGTVAWARAEIDAHRLRYHAGIAFTEHRPELLASLLPDVQD